MPRIRRPKACDVPGCGLKLGHGPVPPFRTMAGNHRAAARTTRDLRAARIGPLFIDEATRARVAR